MSIKLVPMLIALLLLINTILYYYNIDTELIAMVGGMSILPTIFFYLCSIRFKFCAYHRMFLHYIVVVDTLNYIDYYIGIPLSYSGLLRVHLI